MLPAPPSPPADTYLRAPADAPTLDEVIAGGWTMMIHCDRCRYMALVNAKAYAARFGGGVRLSRIRFHCDRALRREICGQRGWVELVGEGNSLMGRPKIWRSLAPETQNAPGREPGGGAANGVREA